MQRAMHPRPRLFLSTPSARRATIEAAKHTDLVHISIHALREEGDVPIRLLFAQT